MIFSLRKASCEIWQGIFSHFVSRTLKQIYLYLLYWYRETVYYSGIQNNNNSQSMPCRNTKVNHEQHTIFWYYWLSSITQLTTMNTCGKLKVTTLIFTKKKKTSTVTGKTFYNYYEKWLTNNPGFIGRNQYITHVFYIFQL